MVIKLNHQIIMVPKTSAYLKSYDGQTKWIYLLIEMMTYLLKKCNTIWDKISADITNNFIASLSTITNF